MHWEKTVCIHLTLRRIVIAVLAASTIGNLLIVGVAFGAEAPQAAPTRTVLLTTLPETATLTIPSSPVVEAPVSTVEEIPTATSFSLPDIAPTETLVPTQMSLEPTMESLCVKRFYWPAYRVQRGDTLFALAVATGSTVRELELANCLANDQIYAGQLLYLPRLFSKSSTSTPTTIQTATPTIAPTDTPAYTATDLPTDTPTDIPTDTPTVIPTNTPTPITPTFTPTYWIGRQSYTKD